MRCLIVDGIMLGGLACAIGKAGDSDWVCIKLTKAIENKGRICRE